MADIHAILKKYWGYDRFRTLQTEIIESVLAGKDTLALLPTGGGKSVCFQVPAMALEGICLVISPLIALMKDQVEQLQKRNIPAMAIFSGMSHREIDIALDNCVFGKIKFLYISPERLKTEMLLERAKRMKISLLAIDEAHCISQWGYDFRPAYLEIANFRQLFPNIPCLALTATATKTVKSDIQEKLLFKEKNVFQKSFARANLSYSCFKVEVKEQKLLDILKKVGGSAVVYANSRKKAQQTAEFLQKNNISADFYHAGLSSEDRNNKQNAWISNKIRVMVATNAFGMGIDKPDVRVVVHTEPPSTLEAYYQEAGRAGRDEKRAYAVLLFHQKDLNELEKNIAQSYPSVEKLKNTYQKLANYYKIAVGSHHMISYDFELADFCQNFQLNPLETHHILKQLEQQGFVQLNDAVFAPSRIILTTNQEELYKFQIANAVLDPVIKFLVRNYGGEIFKQFVIIPENQMAKKLGIPTENLLKQLNFLAEQGILEYLPQKEKPQITFTTSRFNSIDLPINIKDLEERKSQASQKIKAVINYATHEKRCRTQMLLEYFDEITDELCGVCDHCLNEKQSKKTWTYDQKVLDLLKDNSLEIKELEAKIKPNRKEDLWLQIQQLVSSGEVVYDSLGKLMINKV
ncbi:MAG: RecQ family ATP-dependent DNA helicase [Bacteroidetes bacterium]|nr:MAG: RecQ family ATP-dependent DNA helicase [Bacteroidota bacterium]